MSSDGSSGITQFGLYRTIDARTEEFLRLSRRRQIRQGCACAAVSTAITVTVVVSVLLVYEYSIISGSSKNKSYTKPNWLGFINDSADTTPFDAKYSKTKLNLDKSTIKLLPILIKALKQNIFFEKVIEDYTSASPIYEPNETTEQQYEKNVFSDPRNWFKSPPSRVYAIEFKTSPIVYYQPTRNLEYMTKIRKIRDYKRILNYFEKMINDKVNPGSNLMIQRESQTKKPSEDFTTPIIKRYKSNEKHRVTSMNKNLKRPPVIETKTCKCPIKLGELITKLMSNLNQLIPHSKMSLSTLCNKGNPTKQTKSSPKTSNKIATTKFTTLKPVNAITNPTFIEKIKATSEKAYLILQNNMKGGLIRNYVEGSRVNLPLNNNLYKNNNHKMDSTENRIDNYEKQTTVKNFLEATESKSIKSQTTKPMTSVNDKFTNLMYQRFKNDFVTSKPTIATNKIMNKSILSNEDYDDYFITTQRIATNYDALDIMHNLKLIKSEIISPNNKAKKFKNKINEVRPKNVIKTLSDITDPSFSIQKYKNNDFSFENKIGSMFLQKIINTKPNINIQKEKTKAPNIEKSTEVFKSDPIIHNENQFGYDEKVQDDDIFEEYKLKQSSKITELQSINHTDTTPIPIDIPKQEVVKEEPESTENVSTTVTSMLPQARSVYLEIQRNDWKQDDTHDYDFNVNNNLYDFPNI